MGRTEISPFFAAAFVTGFNFGQPCNATDLPAVSSMDLGGFACCWMGCWGLLG